MKCHSKVLLVEGAENAQTCYGSLAVVGAGCGKCGKEPKVTNASLDKNGRNAQEADFAKFAFRPTIVASGKPKRCIAIFLKLPLALGCSILASYRSAVRDKANFRRDFANDGYAENAPIYPSLELTLSGQWQASHACPPLGKAEIWPSSIVIDTLD